MVAKIIDTSTFTHLNGAVERNDYSGSRFQPSIAVYTSAFDMSIKIIAFLDADGHELAAVRIDGDTIMQLIETLIE